MIPVHVAQERNTRGAADFTKRSHRGLHRMLTIVATRIKHNNAEVLSLFNIRDTFVEPNHSSKIGFVVQLDIDRREVSSWHHPSLAIGSDPSRCALPARNPTIKAQLFNGVQGKTEKFARGQHVATDSCPRKRCSNHKKQSA